MSGDGEDLKTEGLALITKGLNDALGEQSACPIQVKSS